MTPESVLIGLRGTDLYPVSGSSGISPTWREAHNRIGSAAREVWQWWSAPQPGLA